MKNPTIRKFQRTTHETFHHYKYYTVIYVNVPVLSNVMKRDTFLSPEATNEYLRIFCIFIITYKIFSE